MTSTQSAQNSSTQHPDDFEDDVQEIFDSNINPNSDQNHDQEHDQTQHSDQQALDTQATHIRRQCQLDDCFLGQRFDQIAAQVWDDFSREN